MKILIVGSDLNSILLAKYIYLQNNEHDIYITSDENESENFYTNINIRENDINSLVDFVKYNAIEFTIVVSQLAIINGIADIFKKEEFPIFAPMVDAARITFFNSIAKKIMYKLKIPTPKFGIFDRENIAIDYVRNSKFPIVLENDFTLTERISNKYKYFSEAKDGIQRIFENGNEKIVIEHYLNSEPLYLYFITDGYNALPLIALERLSGNNYTSITAPTQKIDNEMIVKILHKTIYPILDDINNFSEGYTGILGLKLKLSGDNFAILEFYNGFQFYDFQAFLSVLNDNLLSILYDCANGSLADNYNEISLSDTYSYTIALQKKNIVDLEEDDDNDFFESEYDNKKVLTFTAMTINKAKEKLFSYLENSIEIEALKEIMENDNKREKRI